MIKVSAIIVAAGLSRRMGDRDKMLLPFRGTTVLGYTLGQLSETTVDEIVLVINRKDVGERMIKGFSRLRYVINPDFEKGMTTSIQCGVKATAVDTSGYMICLGDQPLITTEDHELILENFRGGFLKDEYLISVPFFGSKKGNPVIFSNFYKDQILQHQEPEGCRSIIQKNTDHISEVVMPNDHILKDIDTPEDYNSIG